MIKILAIISLLISVNALPDGVTSVNEADQEKASVYCEKDGLVIIDTESLVLPTGWTVSDRFANYSGSGFIEWTGEDYFNIPGNGIINIELQISTPGTYCIQWRSKIGFGDSSTDFNDSWLRLPDANSFYASKGEHRVQPHGICTNDCPEGAGSDGWFKVYLSGTIVWTWATYTYDNNPHQIYAQFDEPGDYTLQISGRSKHHCIDRIILFHSSVEENSAQRLTK